MENTTDKEKITKEQLQILLKEVCDTFNKANIDYLICGSLAYKLLTNDEVAEPHDIDIIVHESDFPKIVDLFKDSDLEPIQTPFSIHANHKNLRGENGEPFDVSLDSFEHYYSKAGIRMEDFEPMVIDGINVRVVSVVSKEGLIKCYETSLQGGNTNKFSEYQRKVDNLKRN